MLVWCRVHADILNHEGKARIMLTKVALRLRERMLGWETMSDSLESAYKSGNRISRSLIVLKCANS